MPTNDAADPTAGKTPAGKTPAAGDDGNDRELRRLAERRAGARLGFYRHLAVYLGVNALLLVINLLTSPGTLWFYWPLLGWGVAIAAHAARVYRVGRGPGLRQRLEEQELQKLKDGQ